MTHKVWTDCIRYLIKSFGAPIGPNTWFGNGHVIEFNQDDDTFIIDVYKRANTLAQLEKECS